MSENLTLQLNRVYKQSRKRVFEAWTTPEQLTQWFAPGPFLAQSAEVDPRQGGIFRVVWFGPSPLHGGEMYIRLSGIYRQFVPNELLCFSWNVEADLGEDTLVTVKFADCEGGTKVSVTQERIPTEEMLKRNGGGWGSCMEKLAVLCEAAEVGAKAFSGVA